jgi:hypothetical protein
MVAFTGCLVLVGAAQCYIVFWTLKATKDAADAAKLSAQAAIGVELPVLFVSKVDFHTQESGISTVTLTITNYGRTPAFLTHESADISVGSLSKTPDYKNIITLSPGTIIDKEGTRILIPRNGKDLP